ncbi:MAG: hypothetical protein CSA95_02730 [Bacteroidetes bacterium]|nr:MAG: hypothetical protein CSA95_02730 [Bacteroidota bacterium]PIE88684.1 MAG: hypothetical protein CSA04_00635 [Bacteroidota bacterium]
MVFLGILCACSKTPPRVAYEVPQELKADEEAVDLIEEMAATVYEINEGMAESMKTAIEFKRKFGNGEDVSSIGKWGGIFGMIKSMFKVNRIAEAQENLETLKVKANVLKESLAFSQISALDTAMAHIEGQIGQIDVEALGLTEEEIKEFGGEDGRLRIGMGDEEEITEEELAEMSPEARERILMDEEMYREREAYLESQGIEEEADTSSNELDWPPWLSIAIPILTLGIIIMIPLVKGIKVIKSLVKRAK